MPSVQISDSVVAYVDPKTNQVALFCEKDAGAEQIECPVESLPGHTRKVLALSPDDTLLVGGGENAELNMWSTSPLTRKNTLSNADPSHNQQTDWPKEVLCADVAQDGMSVLSGYSDNTLKVWDMNGTCRKTLTGHTKPVGCAAFSLDGTKAVSGSLDCTVKIWNIDRQEVECMTLEGHTKEVRDVRFSPDGSKVLSASRDRTMKLWDITRPIRTAADACLRTFSGHKRPVQSVRFSRDGKTILSASKDGTIKLWLSETGECTKSLCLNYSAVCSAVFSFDESLVISGSVDCTVKVWNVQAEQCVRTFEGHERPVRQVRMTRDGKTIFSCAEDGIKKWSTITGMHLRWQSPSESTIAEMQLASNERLLVLHCEDNSQEINVDISDLPRPSDIAFASAMARGLAYSRSIKLILMGPPEAGKTALLAALSGEELPNKEDRSVAVRLHKLRLVLNKRTGVFEPVSPEEFHLASVIAAMEEEANMRAVEDEAESCDGSSAALSELDSQASYPSIRAMIGPSVWPPIGQPHDTNNTTAQPSTAFSASPALSAGMEFARTQLSSELPREHIDVDAYDFAGESMYESLSALIMGSESIYVLVFDLSVMLHDLTARQQQYQHLAKWAHIIAHQVPSTDKSYFRVIIVGTHLDTFPNNALPPDLISKISPEILSLVDPVLGNHLITPRSVPFFQVGSKGRLGLEAVRAAVQSAVRNRALPLEFVAAQDLIGRWARLGHMPLLSSPSALPQLVLNKDPLVTLGGMIPCEKAICEGLVPYLESAADILVCREDATSELLNESDTIVFDVPRLISALELLCSVVMAQWGRTESRRAHVMLREVIAAGFAYPEGGMSRTTRLLQDLVLSKDKSEYGFPAEVAEWLVWTAPADRAEELFEVPRSCSCLAPSFLERSLGHVRRLFHAKTRPKTSVSSPEDFFPLLAGAAIPDVSSFMISLERLSLVFRRGDRLFVPMLLPDYAPFLDFPISLPVQVFLYQFVDDMLLPVSLATFHLLMVALWRTSLLNSSIQATQRCTNAMTMAECAPVRLQLNPNDAFVRIDVLNDSDAKQVQHTLEQICVKVCEQTRSLRWGWRGTPVLVPAHTHKSNLPLFPPENVARSPLHYREENSVRAEMAAHPGERVCNKRLEKWWILEPCTPPVYTHAAALIVGVSHYGKDINPVLEGYSDLPGVIGSVDKLAKLWQRRDFKVQKVVDRSKEQRVTREAIVAAVRKLAEDMGENAGEHSLLVVHLLGHGAEDTRGGLLLSDARENVGGQLSRFTLIDLQAILHGEVFWRGCNILVVTDFCNSGALQRGPELNMAGYDDERPPRPVPGQHARQLITSALKDGRAYTNQKETKLTELLVEALGTNEGIFRERETVVSAVQLCDRLQRLDPNVAQVFSVGRIWSDWNGTPNDGDVFIYRSGNGVRLSWSESK